MDSADLQLQQIEHVCDRLYNATNEHERADKQSARRMPRWAVFVAARTFLFSNELDCTQYSCLAKASVRR